MTDLSTLAYESTQIRERREKVRQAFIAQSGLPEATHFTHLRPETLACLFDLYDKHFFARYFEKQGIRACMSFRFSQRLSKSAGNIRYRYQPRSFCISISARVFLSSFQKSGESYLVNGHRCTDRLQALQFVFEHELVHLIEYVLYGRSGHGASFRGFVQRIFGHTAYKHQLFTPQHRVQQELGLKNNDWVTFSYQGKQYVGRLQRITKRATVMVPDRNGNYQDRQGQRYCKYYVPVSLLKKSKAPRG